MIRIHKELRIPSGMAPLMFLWNDYQGLVLSADFSHDEQNDRDSE